MNNPSRMAIENALMRALIRSMAGVIVNMIEHSANLNNWKASYHLVKMFPHKYENPPRDSLAEKHVFFSKHYEGIIFVLEEATAFLEGHPLRKAVEAAG